MDLFDLAAKITLDSSEYEKGLEKAKGGFSTAGKIIGGALTAAAAAGTAALVSVSKQAVEAYANYEQLVGGVDTLFKDSSDLVQQYAANAYKTAGLSANQYMETVTSFSASLLQSLDGDTEKAAKAADMAITDMSDNANKMGTSMESIQNAYQGFAKQNYTMLDNLKLGYGGTKEEMQRLLEDAEKFSGVKYDISSLSDVYEAIHVVQTELDITGTTAKEASTTISGSVASMKSAWENLVVGIADENANFEVLVSDFVDSLVTVGDNLIPRIEQTLSGVGTLLTSFSETILPKVIDTIVENLPKIIETGITIVIKLIEGLAKAIPQLVQAVPEIVESVVKTIIGMLPELVDVGKQMVLGVWEGIKGMASWFKEKVSDFFNGVVDNVKGVLGIHSPSRVFAGIGENMALGLGKGWDSEYNDIKNGIESGLDFGTASVNVASASNAGNSGFAGAFANAAQEIVLNITETIDGAVLARNQYRYNVAEASRHGASLVVG